MNLKTHRKIKKILFVSPPLLAEKGEFYPDFPTPPLGIAYISSNADSLDSPLVKDILDFSFYENWEDIYSELGKLPDYDLYAFTSMTPNFSNLVKVARYLRERRDCLFVIGGSQATIYPGQVLDLNIFDICVVNEGEETFRELISCINSKGDIAKVKGLWFRDQGGEIRSTGVRPYIKDLDTLCFPDWDLLPMKQYIKTFGDMIFGERGATAICSRGCVFDCAFCAKDIFQSELRRRSPENVIEEVKRLTTKYQLDTVHFVDDNFTGNNHFIKKFCQLMRESKLPVQWRCESRIDMVNAEILGIMKEGGCKGIMYGVESGDQQVLDNMNKKLKVERIVNVCEETHRAGISIGAFIMIGFPGETRESLRRTIDLVRKIDLNHVALAFATMLPGTKLYKKSTHGPGKFDINFSTDYHIKNNIKLDQIEFDDLLAAQREIFDIVYGSKGAVGKIRK